MPIQASELGITGPSCSLRDPYVFSENGKLYMLYSFCGEKGIALAELSFRTHKKYHFSPEIFTKPAMDYCELILLTPKESLACGITSPEVNEILMTGMGRSGTQYLANCLNQAGFNFTHDNTYVDYFNDGSVSWPSLFKNYKDDWNLNLGEHLFSRIGLQTRDPLKSIASRVSKIDVVHQTKEVVYWKDKYSSDLEVAMIHYVLWNSFASLVGDFQFRIEDVNSFTIQDILKNTRLDLLHKDFSICDTISSKTHASLVPPHEQLYWDLMAKENLKLTRMVCTLALKFGYECKFLPAKFSCWLRYDSRWTCEDF